MGTRKKLKKAAIYTGITLLGVTSMVLLVPLSIAFAAVNVALMPVHVLTSCNRPVVVQVVAATEAH